MRNILAVTMLGVLTALFTVTDAHALLGFLEDKFSKQPYAKMIVNGQERHAKVNPLPQNSRLIEWLDAKGGPTLYWLEKMKKDGRIVWQAAPFEISTYEYKYDKNGRPESVRIKIIWPELKSGAITPKLEPCQPAEVVDCFRLKENAIHTEVIAKRDESGKIVGGMMRNTFFLENGELVTKAQRINVSYPNSNIMRLTFEGFGEPWAYVDAWQEYRVEDEKIVWEICRTFGKFICMK